MQFEKIRVIIVDDHPMVRETWKMLLESSNKINVVRECHSGGEVIDCAAELAADVILMDINMKPVNGFEATRKILKETPGQKIIGISMNNQPGYARNMMQLGARGYVTKNSSKDEMLRAIHTVMDGRIYICKEVLSQMDDTNKQ